jgi:hypothetical protein
MRSVFSPGNVSIGGARSSAPKRPATVPPPSCRRCSMPEATRSKAGRPPSPVPAVSSSAPSTRSTKPSVRSSHAPIRMAPSTTRKEPISRSSSHRHRSRGRESRSASKAGETSNSPKRTTSAGALAKLRCHVRIDREARHIEPDGAFIGYRRLIDVGTLPGNLSAGAVEREVICYFERWGPRRARRHATLPASCSTHRGTVTE